MLGRLIRIVGIVGLSDSRTVNLSEMLDRPSLMETVRQADQNCWNGWILGFLDSQIVG